VVTFVPGQLAALIAGAGYGAHEPVIAGMAFGADAPVFASQGQAGAGAPLGPATVAYTASLSKQVTAACTAFLVQDGALDPADTLARWLPELPAWAGTVCLRHVLYHTGSVPDRAVKEIVGDSADWTTPAVLAALARISALPSPPGTAHLYSNTGYICLAVAVERAAGQSLAEFARQRIFGPLGMTRTRYWSGPRPAPPGAAALPAGYPAPLSLGDGGM
jgi:CubicO group peptidase (beta-lactamase class C family)